MLKEEREKLKLERVCIGEGLWYSMWQVREEMERKVEMEGKKKNRVRYVLQNRTKKDSRHHVIKLLTKPAKEVLFGGAHLLTSNKFSTFVHVDEFSEGGSFSFLSHLIESADGTFLGGKKYVLCSSSVSGGCEIRVADEGDSARGES